MTTLGFKAMLNLSRHHGMARPHIADRGDGLQTMLVANILNKQSLTADSGWSSSLVVERWLTTPHRRKGGSLRNILQPRNWIHGHDISTGKWIRFLGKARWKILGRPKRRWEAGIRMDLWEIVWEVWSGFNWFRAGCWKCGDEPSGSGATEFGFKLLMYSGFSTLGRWRS
jgi:hypothetical protein